MRKSNKIKLSLLTLPLIFAAVAAVACGGDHTHEYSSEWAFDAASHWHPSTCSHDTKTNKSEHSFVKTVIPPSFTSAGYTLNTCACGYSYTSDSVSSLPVESGDYRFDENGHWKPVLSGDEIDVEAHEYDDSVVEPTCSTYGYVKHTCKCGYWYASDTTLPTAHEYDENVWGHDENGHWHPALCCNAKSGTVAHNYKERIVNCEESGDPDGKGYTEFTCTDCGYSYRGRETDGHTYSDTLSSDEYEHWRQATCSHNVKTDIEDHVFIGNSVFCEVCGKTVTERRLAYQLSADGNYYIVTGAGNIEDSTRITVPDSFRDKPVQEIADRAFKDGGVISVTFGKNLKKIGAEAFSGASISELDLPSGLEEIGAKAFEGINISSLALGSSLEKIGSAAFRNCADLQTVTASGGMSDLAAFAFENCTKLTSVTGAKPTHIGAQAFSGCTQLTALDLSECVSVGFAAFGGCSKFAPDDLHKLSLTEEYAFSGCAIESVTLPELKQVADNLFKGCEKLTSVTLAAESIGKSAFEDCSLLSFVSLNGTQLIGESAFKNCTNLESLTLPDTIIRVGKSAFEGTKLISTESGVQYAAGVVIGASSNSFTVKEGTIGIADGAFKDNQTLTSVTLGGVRFIGVDAFRSCTALTAITFTQSVRYIGANSFRESGLISVTVPATVLSVGDNAFYDCRLLTSVNVSAKTIGRFAFSYTGVNRSLDNPVKERPDYAKLTVVTLGEGVEAIGSNAFQYCPITSVTLPASLKDIGKYAFAQTDLTSITIPASVTRIGEYCFYGCNALTSVTFASTAGWKAGKTSLNVETPSQNAMYLKTTYCDIDWIKE